MPQHIGERILRMFEAVRFTHGACGGQQTGSRVVRWERRDNRVLLRGISYEITADSALPISACAVSLISSTWADRSSKMAWEAGSSGSRPWAITC